jgi:holo-[acyl-carrier protein] synthase
MQFYSNKMIFGIGIDLVSIDRIEKLMLQFKEKFAEKIFTSNEILRANQIKTSDKNSSAIVLFYAKRFAAKEAFSKALGLGIGRGIDFKDIEIENDELGKPQIKILNGKEIFLAQHLGCKNFAIHLSLTDEKSMAQAMVIINKI